MPFLQTSCPFLTVRICRTFMQSHTTFDLRTRVAISPRSTFALIEHAPRCVAVHARRHAHVSKPLLATVT
eukprot:299592-Pyramimonas_sp.AAC.1